MKLLMIITLIFITTTRSKIISYDCAHSLSNVTKINMLSSSKCIFTDEEPTIKKVEIVLVQSSSFFKVHIFQCKVSISRIVTKCGTFSDSIVKSGFMNYIKDLTIDECKDLQKYGSINLFGRHKIDGLKPNSTTSKTLVLAGSIDDSGSCSGDSYSDAAGDWQKVYVVANVEITLRDSYTHMNTDSQDLKLPSGLSCNLGDSHCLDFEDGFTYWDDNFDKSCAKLNYDLIYKGTAKKSVMNTLMGQSTLFTVEGSETSFSLMVKSYTKVCGHKAFQTEHPKLKILLSEGIEFGFEKNKDIMNLDMFAFINSKFAYLERHFQDQLKSLHKALLAKQCELDRHILNTQLALAYQSPSDFALLRMGEPGFTALPAGEVMYLIKCQAVETERFFSDKCYQEFPVIYQNSTWFMSPRTHILQKSGNEVQCSEVVPVNFFIQGRWYSFNPKIHETTAPTNLVPDSQSSWNYNQPSPLMNSGLYSEGDLEQLRMQIMMPADIKTVTSTITNKVTGSSHSNNGFKLSNLIESAQMEVAIDSYFSKITGFFGLFGTSISAIIGLYATFRIVKYVFDTVIHAKSLYKIYGVSPAMLAMFWDSLTTHLVVKNFSDHPGSKSKSDLAEQLQLVNPARETTMMEDIQPASAPLDEHMRVVLKGYNNQISFMCVQHSEDVEVILGGVSINTFCGKQTITDCNVFSIKSCRCNSPKYIKVDFDHQKSLEDQMKLYPHLF